MRLIISILFRHVAEEQQQQPPAKRRRGIAGSIVSTAVSAALIGTAVGLTVYRLWRDRGKDSEPPVITIESPSSTPPPPPPYSSSDPQAQQPPTLNVVPATPRITRKSRNHPVHSARRRPRRVHASLVPGPSGSSSTAIFPPTPPQFDFSSSPQRLPRSPALSRGHSYEFNGQDDQGPVDAATDAVDDQMDWIGSKLSSLIEEGRKALGKQVVVMSEVQEDEVDDGSGEWVEEDEDGRGRRSRGNSVRSGSTSRRRTPAIAAGSLGRRAGGMTINPPPYGHGVGSSSSSASLSASPRHSQFAVSASASLPVPINSKEDVHHSSWESPEVRESMERARAKVLERRAQQQQRAQGGPSNTSFS